MASKKQKPTTARRSNALPLVFISAGVLVVLAALYLAFHALSAGSPRLSVDQTTIDFGEVKLGETVTARFTITNSGSAPLRFRETPYVELKEGC